MSRRDDRSLPSEDRWQRLQELFADAMDLADSERIDFLDDVESRDAALGDELRSLLAHHEDDLPELRIPESADQMPRRLGPYRILEELGRGGMGTVYLAERADGEFEGQVAIKVLRRDLEGAEARQRFLRERQFLADLKHPQIVSLLDAGTSPEGELWLAMDYVDGQRIDQYCKLNALSLESRIEVFREICSVVHFAHQNLIVHRDLKPSNILVGSDGVPLLLDFGIAKLMAEHADMDVGLSWRGASPRTPEYASPEQIAGVLVTTASDIYALGTILFEMLVGRRPHEGVGRQVERRIIDAEPPTPSASLVSFLTASEGSSESECKPRQLRGDLDAIILRALHKSPSQRYGSVAELSEDLASYQQGLPVKARQGSTLYRLSKFVRRHWLSLVPVLLIIGLLTSLVVSRLLQTQQLAREAEKVRTMNAFLEEILSSPDPYEGLGRGVTISDAMLAAVDRIDDAFVDQPELAANAKFTLGTIFTRLGNYWQAESLLTDALAMRRQLFVPPSVEIVEAGNRLGQVLVKLGRNEEAEPLIAEMLSMLDQLPQTEPQNLAASISSQAWVEAFQGNYEAAEPLYYQALAIRRAELGPENSEVAVALNDLAALMLDMGRFDESEQLYAESLAMRRRIYGDHHPTIAQSLGDMGLLFKEQGEFEAAERLYLQSLAMERETLGDLHPNVAVGLNNLSNLLQDQGRYDEARSYIEEALTIRRQVLGEQHPFYATSLDTLGSLLAAKGDFLAAEEYLERAIRVFELSLGKDHIETAKSLNNMGYVKIERGRYAEAAPFIEQALAIYRRRFGEDHPEVATSSNNLAVVRYRLGEIRPAAEAFREVLRIERKSFGAKHPDTAVSLINLGNALGDLGEYEEAEGLLEEALGILRQLQEKDSPLEGATLGALGRIYQNTERWPEAEEVFRQAVEAERRVLGPDHPNVASNLNQLARLLSERSHDAEAETLYREAYRIYEANPEYGGAKRIILRMYLGELLCGMGGKTDEGFELLRLAEKSIQEELATDHWLLGAIDGAWGACLADQGDHDAAEPLLRRGLLHLKDVLGEEHLRTKMAVRRLQRLGFDEDP